MSDAEFEAEIQKEAERLNREFQQFVHSGKSYEEFMLEGDIAAFEKTLRQRQKEEQTDTRQKPTESSNLPDNQAPKEQSDTILKTIDQLLSDLEEKKERLSENPKESSELKPAEQSLDDVLQKSQQNTPDPLDFLDDL